jgi:nucleotide-binding universal stress UspA family protein
MIASRVSHILVPIDFGPGSESALRYAKMLAAKFGASLHLLHVLDDVNTGDASALDPHKSPATDGETCAADEGTRLCNLLSRDEVTRFHATGTLVFGSTGASIAKYARQRGIDLIVMETNGCTRLATTALGSIAECVVRTAHCPVLEVRDSGAVRVLHPSVRSEARTRGHHANHTH